VGIHALDAVFVSAEKAWITGSSSVMATMGTGSRLGKKSPHRLASFETRLSALLRMRVCP
jgi:hypothetical protein